MTLVVKDQTQSDRTFTEADGGPEVTLTSSESESESELESELERATRL